MDGFWVQVLVALLAAAFGAGATIAAVGVGLRRRSTVSVLPNSAAPSCAPGRDRWLSQMHRCDQAVCRAARAVDSVSSTKARHGLRSVVRRMDAELPNVRALVELGRSLESSSVQSSAASRVYQHLDNAAARFSTITDEVLDTLAELVAEPDLGRVHQRVTALRDEFPLLRPMSALLGSAPGESASRALADMSV